MAITFSIRTPNPLLFASPLNDRSSRVKSPFDRFTLAPRLLACGRSFSVPPLQVYDGIEIAVYFNH